MMPAFAISIAGLLGAVIASQGIAWAATGSPGAESAGAAADSGSSVRNVRDPFKKPQNETPESEHKHDLEKYAADQFKMTGVILGTGRLRAMLKGPNGKTYFVTVGTRIGVRSGVVSKITSDAVFVKERVINILGSQEDVTVVINMDANATGGQGAGTPTQPPPSK